MTTRSAPRALPAITEKQFMAQVLQLAAIRGWWAYHPTLSKWSARGWPDLAIIRPPRALFAELKAERGKLTADQTHVLELLAACPGLEVYVWRPSDLDDIARILK